MRDRDLVDAAWAEWREQSSYRGESPDGLELRPPRWFVQEELGFSLDSGPSLRWNCDTLERANRAALVQLGREAPLWVTYPKDFARDPRARRRRPAAASRHERVESAASMLSRIHQQWFGEST